MKTGETETGRGINQKGHPGGLSQKSLKGAVRETESCLMHAWSREKGNFTPVSFQGTRAVQSA